MTFGFSTGGARVDRRRDRGGIAWPVAVRSAITRDDVV